MAGTGDSSASSRREAAGRRLLLVAGLVAGLAAAAGAVDARAPETSPPPPPRPASILSEAPVPEEEEVAPAGAAVPTTAPTPEPAPEAAPATAAAPAPASEGRGPVTNLPLPRFVTLKTSEGNARRGPGTTHRIDWVFTRPGMPLRIIAEHENWRRVEDHEGAGGWVHYALLSGARAAIVTTDGAALREGPEEGALLRARIEAGVIGRIIACEPDWCRISTDGWRGWVAKTDLWGVEPDETID
jgi:SH3-like domain-containing protein